MGSTQLVTINRAFIEVFSHNNQLQYFLLLVNGNWSTWSIWENCDVTCGFGMQKRTRACDNPYPVFNGIICTGNDLQTQNCSTTPCPGMILVYILYLMILIGFIVASGLIFDVFIW
jgi:hypothetical protein